MLDDAPAEVHILQLLCRGLTLRSAHILNNLLGLGVELLNKQTAIHGNILVLNSIGIVHIDLQEAKILLCREHLQSLLGERGSHNNLQEDGLHQLGNLLR